MKKIILFFAFIILSCSSGNESTPTEPVDPVDPGINASVTYFDDVHWDGYQFNFSWIPNSENPDVNFYQIYEREASSQVSTKIWESANSEQTSASHQAPIGRESIFYLNTINKNGSSESSKYNVNYSWTRSQALYHWEKSYNILNTSDLVADLEKDNDNNFISVIQVSPNATDGHYFFKFDNNGDEIFKADIGFDKPLAIDDIYNEEGYFVSYLAKVGKLDSNASVIWKKDLFTNDIISTNNGNFYVGSPYDCNGGIGIGNFDNDGNIIWSKDVGCSSSGVGGAYTGGFRIDQIDENNFIAVGNVAKYENNNNVQKGYIVKFDSNGELVFEKWFDNILHFEVVKVLSNGNILIAGDSALVFVDDQGNILSETNKYQYNGYPTDNFSTESYFDFTDAIQLDNGNVLLVGKGWVYNGRQQYGFRPDEDIVLIYLDENGSLVREFILHKRGGFDKNVDYGDSENPYLSMSDDGFPILIARRDINGGTQDTPHIFIYKLFNF